MVYSKIELALKALHDSTILITTILISMSQWGNSFSLVLKPRKVHHSLAHMYTKHLKTSTLKRTSNPEQWRAMVTYINVQKAITKFLYALQIKQRRIQIAKIARANDDRNRLLFIGDVKSYSLQLGQTFRLLAMH